MKHMILALVILGFSGAFAEMKLGKINQSAPKGGVFSVNKQSEPPSLHPIYEPDLMSQEILTDYLCDHLAIHDPTTYEYKGRIAEKWEVSKDNKTFTFFLRKDATFQDGKPITAEDVKFSFDAIRIPEFKAADKIPYIDAIESIEVVNPTTVKFKLKDTYFMNFEVVALNHIIPKHVYSDVQKAKDMHKEVVCSGPYMIEKYDKGQRLLIKRFEGWYGLKDPYWKGEANFDKIQFRFIKEDPIAIESLKKGDIQYYQFKVPDSFYKAEGAMFGKTLLKIEAENNTPKPYGFYGFDLRNALFKDKKVRFAMSLLMNREEMNKKFRYGKSKLATGPIGIAEYDPGVKAIPYNPKKAQELLSQAGWKDTDKDGILDKMIDGKKTDFKFTLSYASKDSEKYHTWFKEDLKKVGIEMELKFLEWNSFTKAMDKRNFDLMAMSWGGGTLNWDPKQIWHSESMNTEVGGSNYASYSNKEVDKLIDQARMEPNDKKRMKMLRRVYKMIAEDMPYIFWFNPKYDTYMVSTDIGRPGDSMKYDIGYDWFWNQKEMP